MQKNKSIKSIITMFFVTFFINSKLVSADICSNSPDTIKLLQQLLGIVKVAIPILLIALGTMDFVKAMIAQDDQQMKKAQGTFVKRLIIGIVIFFVPMIMRFLFSIALPEYSDSCLFQLVDF